MISLEDKLKNLPEKPGVYIMRDEYNEIIYIGKAINLKNRVRQYFQNSKNQHPKVAAMVERITDLEYIITDSELEALILECNFIKKHRPKYNVMLKDDKQYPYIKITVKEDYPRLLIVREIKKDGAKYFGPYTDVTAVNRTIDLLKGLFPIRYCSKNISRAIGKERPCLNYHIKKCIGPCQGNVSKEQYRELIDSVIMMLEGKQEEVLKQLEDKMHQAADNLDFEKAAEIRDNMNSLIKIAEKQKVISSALIDQDIIAFALNESESCIQVFFVRGGKLIGREHFLIEDTKLSDSKEILSSFIKQYYGSDALIPREIILQEEIDEINIIERWLSDKKGGRVKLVVPRRGEKQKLIEMVSRNAEDTLRLLIEKQKNDTEKTMGACRELKDILELNAVPVRIEAFDISNIQGVLNVGSMIVFEQGKPNNRNYRRFRIKSVEGANDYESMREIVERRFVHGLKEREELEAEGKDFELGRFSVFPDMILLDGGIGQVNAVLPVLRELDINIPVCGMVKDDKHRTRGLIYNGREIELPKASKAFRLISAIQEEAHRFAISYHKSLRSKTTVKSALDDIPGIGPARRKALLKSFGSLKNIKKASLEELEKVQGMNRKVAEVVYNFFNS
ncbi:MAG TPA: excinuclease ABC subunit UvrC [Bacillota bacterium]|nr:excinuclease ABC subunit UvrC [Bacillota bacterium]HQE65909.1 excinuclease ABC subunit UvrC [Bacillota bacterium]HQJ36712.1 excinuclease ABC subunit UvrC [Bacillota bacterium]